MNQSVIIKSKREIELMKNTCRLAANVLEYISEFIEPGITTEELNQKCHDYIIEHGATPSPLNYHGFPKSICTSINNVICHGIPSEKAILKDGDIINVDVTTYLNGFHGDTNRTFFVGEVDSKVRALVEVTYDCMMAGINVVRPGAHLGDIGATIAHLAHSHHYSVVTDYCGHGIGRDFHEAPQVIHNATRGEGITFKEGMIFTVEPMINMGKKHTKLLKDNWTVITRDKSLSAQFEHTVLVTQDGHEILTIPKE